jgi:ribonuclease HII
VRQPAKSRNPGAASRGGSKEKIRSKPRGSHQAAGNERPAATSGDRRADAKKRLSPRARRGLPTLAELKARKTRRARAKYRLIQQQFIFKEAVRMAGVDEAGRGPLAGPVVAAAVILNPRRPIRGLADSKVLEPAERERLAGLIRKRALAWSVAWADREEIDTINILQATLLAMRRALLGLSVCPDAVQFDGNIHPSLQGVLTDCPAIAVVEGDALVPAISAASILAKTFRDAWMRRLHERFPQYNFASHKGYYTPEHMRALDEHGACELHRRSFAPVYAVMENLADADGLDGILATIPRELTTLRGGVIMVDATKDAAQAIEQGLPLPLFAEDR